MTEAEKKFSAENGMSSAQAWDFVIQWKQAGKIDEAKKGAEEILRFFPDNQEARAMLKRITEEREMTVTNTPVGQPQTLPKKKGFLERFKEKLSGPQPLPGMQIPNDDERIAGIFCYFYFVVIIPLILKRESEFVQFHAWQGLVLTVFVWLFFGTIIKLLIFLKLGPIVGLIYLLTVFLYLYGMYSSYRGIWLRIPIIYHFSEKIRKLF